MSAIATATPESANDAPATIGGISSMATRHVLADLAGAYESRTGTGVSIESVGGVDAARRIHSGERFDFAVLAADAIDALQSAGRIVQGSTIGVARSRVAVAVAAGSRHPDIGSEAALRQALLDARRIGYSTGPSGACLARLLDRWGIAAALEPRMVQASPGVPVGALVARGEVELGLQQLSELLHVPGIEVVGSFPPGIEADTVFSGAICAASRRREAAREFLSFLASAAANGVKRRHGMESASDRDGADAP